MATKVPPPLLPLIRTTNSYSRIGHHWENPKHGGEAEGPPCTTETRTNCLRRRREIILVDPIVSRPAPHHVDRSPLSPITPVANQHPPALWITLTFHYEDCRAICGSGGVGARNNQRMDLGRLNSYLRCPSSNRLMQNQVQGTLWPGNLAGCRCAWFWSLIRWVLQALYLGVSTPRQGTESQPYSL